MMRDRRSKSDEPRPRPGPLLAVLTAALLTLAAAPFGQAYLAWVALAPLVIATGRTGSCRRAMGIGWLAGVLYFGANLWWLWAASLPGTLVLILYLAIFWSLFAALVYASGRLLGLRRPNGPLPNRSAPTFVFVVAAAWVAIEWIRCNIAVEFPWLTLGGTQTPLPVLCQVADIGGPWIVSFWVMLPNALLAAWWLHRAAPSTTRPATAVVLLVLVAVVAYGAWRISSTQLRPGPRVMVVQSNFPHLPGGAATVERPRAVEWYLHELEKHLPSQPVDLVILPEAAFPPLNDEARTELARSAAGPFLENTLARLKKIAGDHRVTILVGASAVTGWATVDGERIGTEIRNSVYLLDPSGPQTIARYDKIHLVRFAERPAISFGPQWLRTLLMGISAPRVSQPLVPGDMASLVPFSLSVNRDPPSDSVPFVSPICLENIDPRVVMRFVAEGNSARKRASFIANVSNDGWFAHQEKYQHWQTILFRSIESRVPMARSSNTGISGFVDSVGRPHATLPPSVAGHSVWQLELDDRETFYMRYGDLFAFLCILVTASVLVVAAGCEIHQRLRQKRAAMR